MNNVFRNRVKSRKCVYIYYAIGGLFIRPELMTKDLSIPCLCRIFIYKTDRDLSQDNELG